MNIDREHLNKIAHLARLEFDESDAEKMMKDMSAIVQWVEKLKEVNTDGVEPLISMSYEINSFREDVVVEHLPKERTFANAPMKDENFFLVPKVIE